MKYINAEHILPKRLIEEIQQYAEGTYIYIPTNSPKKSWGEKSGTRKMLIARNRDIHKRFEEGDTIAELAITYYLSESTIRKIIKNIK